MAVAVLVLVVQGALVAGWQRTVGVPGARGGALVLAAAGVSADLAVLVAPPERPLRALPAVLAAVVVAGLVHQVARGGDREDLVASLSATVTGALVAALVPVHLATVDIRGGSGLVVCAVLPAAAVTALTVLRRARRVPARRRPARAAVLAAGVLGTAALTGVVVAARSDHLDLVTGLTAAGSAAVAAVGGSELVARAARPAVLATVAGLPQALAAPVVYVVGRVLVG